MALLSLVGLAEAGDRAALNILGYSLDATSFAFEEYGIRDGSGLPYSSIYIVDLAKDQWIAGSPFRTEASENEPACPSPRFEVRCLPKRSPS